MIINNNSKKKTTPAEYYSYVDDLWIISCYFNPQKFKRKKENYDLFIDKIRRSNLNYIVVECAFGNDEFELTPAKNILQVRAKDVMWQKERLLNHAIKSLPESCTKVAWLDCDILFVNPDWALNTSLALNRYKVVQPFDFAIRLPKDTLIFEGSGDRYPSFAYIYKNFPNILTSGKFAEHGHPGFAWAAQKNILEKFGLYDVFVNADHLMAHAFCGDWDEGCVSKIMGTNLEFYTHFLNWSKSIYGEVRGKVSYVPGAVLHLWHGDLLNRKYVEIEKKMESLKYNPAKDLKISKTGSWEWEKNNDELEFFFKNYFEQRKEDG